MVGPVVVVVLLLLLLLAKIMFAGRSPSLLLSIDEAKVSKFIIFRSAPPTSPLPVLARILVASSVGEDNTGFFVGD